MAVPLVGARGARIPGAVAIYNDERTLQLGYVPAAVAPELARDEQAVSLWRVEGGLRVLIAPGAAWIGAPARLGGVRMRTAS